MSHGFGIAKHPLSWSSRNFARLVSTFTFRIYSSDRDHTRHAEALAQADAAGEILYVCLRLMALLNHNERTQNGEHRAVNECASQTVNGEAGAASTWPEKPRGQRARRVGAFELQIRG